MRNVNILYLFATGEGVGPYAKDIRAWSDLRRIPAMSLYFNHVHCYHVSYAAFDPSNDDASNDYVRARRYRPDLGGGLKQTALSPDYDHTGLFAPRVPHHITVIRKGADLYFHVGTDGQSRLFHWSTSNQAPLESGRIGFRHMFGRAARYANIRVWQLDGTASSVDR